MAVQSVIFEQRWWTPARAAAWLRSHGFLAPPDTLPDVTPGMLRYRQFQPEPGANYYTKELSGYPGAKLVISLGSRAPQPSGAGRREPREPRFDPSYSSDDDDELRTAEGYDLFEVNRETSDEELSAWGEANIPGFLGVVARQDLCSLYPEGVPMTPGSSCILNLDYGDYGRGGTHWCAMRVARDSPQVYYIDPFGAPPPRDVTLRAMLDSRTVLYPDIMNQGLEEVNCGPRALAVLHMLAEGAEKGEEGRTFGDIAHV